MLRLVFACVAWLGLAAACAWPTPARPGIYTIRAGTPFKSHSLGGMVVDPSGAGIPGVQVRVCRPDWKKCDQGEWRKTNDSGEFSFHTSVKGTYYLRLEFSGFNNLECKVKVNRRTGGRLRLTMELAT